MKVKRHRDSCQHLHYLMTCDEYGEMRREAKNACQMCRTRSGPLFIDHDAAHGIWAVRGLLCNSCNTSLGMPKTATFHRPAISYLQEPWHGKIFVPQPDEPAIGTTVTGRFERRWKRGPKWWYGLKRNGNRNSVCSTQSWDTLWYMQGPHLTVLATKDKP